jgi:RNA polymerase sigma factor (sigma-70 family)
MTTLTRPSPHFPIDLAAIYQEYQPKIEGYIYRRTSDPTLTEDLTAQVFLNVLEATKAGKGAGQHFNSWLYRIAHNLVIDHYRTRDRRQDIPLEDAPHLHSEPDSTTDVVAHSLTPRGTGSSYPAADR